MTDMAEVGGERRRKTKKEEKEKEKRRDTGIRETGMGVFKTSF